MEEFFFIGLAAFAVVAAIKFMTYRNQTEPNKPAETEVIVFSEVPAGMERTLGVRLEEAVPLAEKLNEAWSKPFETEVRERLIQRGALSAEEYDWHLLELKRFFILSAVMHVPMYSEKADAIWHEMILFTKEYASFCDRFTGSLVHHSPVRKQKTTTPGDARHERAVFEIVYSTLFHVHSYTEPIHGLFGSSLLRREFVLEYEALDSPQLAPFFQEAFFRPVSAEQRPLVQAAAREIAKDAAAAGSRAGRKEPFEKSLKGEGQAALWIMYTSAEEAHGTSREKESAGGYASCQGGLDRSGSSDNGPDSGSSDSGSGSSCSSGGGGCSS